MGLVKRLLDSLDSVVSAIGTVFIILIAFLMLSEIVLRQIFGIGLTWIQVVVTMLLPFTVFLLIGPVARRDEQIRIGFLCEFIFKKRAKAIWGALENLFSLGICSFLIWASYRLISLRIRTGSTFMLSADPPFEVSDWIPIVVLALGLFVAIAFYLERVFKQIQSLRRHGTEGGVGPGGTESAKQPANGEGEHS